MRFEIIHKTSYDYDAPVSYLIQLLRMTPSNGSGQVVEKWGISAPTRLQPQTDAFGNHIHLLTVTAPTKHFDITVQGTVEVFDDERSHRFSSSMFHEPSPLVFTQATRYTQPDNALIDLGRDVLKDGNAREADFFNLMHAVYHRIAYVTGSTSVWTTAAQSLEQGMGVCQDHAHVFLACCHAVGIPARYVSGYLNTGDTGHVASHAWVDVLTPSNEWLSLDITNQSVTDGRHCRLAVGRDYDSAAPVRGSRLGGGAERMDAHVFVSGHLSGQ